MEDALDMVITPDRPVAAPPDVLSRLAGRARDGDRQALDSLLRACSDDLLRVCTRLLGDREDGKEAVQEAFVRICRGLPSYDPRRPPRPWLMQVAARAARDCRRRRTSRLLRVVPSAVASDRLADGRVGPESAASARQARSSLKAGLAILTPRERDAFVLRELEGMDTAAVARLLGCRQRPSAATA